MPYFTLGLPNPDYIHPCDDLLEPDGEPDACEVQHRWYGWIEEYMCLVGIPWTTAPPCLGAWMVDGGMPPHSAWTGFFGGKHVTAPRSYPRGDDLIPPTSIGARVLGQSLNDHFGTAVGSNGTWLYIAAPLHTALEADVPALASDRANSGVVYQLRTDARTSEDQPNMAQLWIEPGIHTFQDPDNPDEEITDYIRWPYVDAEIPSRRDYTMPVPHQYIIETVGSLRGMYWNNTADGETLDTRTINVDGACLEDYLKDLAASIGKDWVDADDLTFEISDASRVGGYEPYPTATAGYYTDRTPQIVGPHVNAELSAVRALSDLNDDGVRDFAVGSGKITDPDPNSPSYGQTVGAIYILPGRPTGVEGDYLLEQVQLAPSDPERLEGVMLKGSSAGETLARVFENAGDINGDGIDDVIVGNEGASGDTGEAIVIFGSDKLQSPHYGWTVDTIVAADRAIRFVGENPGDLAGANVAGAGDVDNDGYADILVAAPGALGNKGCVYLVYGSPDLSGDFNLADIGTIDLPGVRFLGRSTGDQLGAGMKTIAGTAPGGGSTTAYSRGVARLGDIDGDGRADYAISAMLANPDNREDAGEIYILYGVGD